MEMRRQILSSLFIFLLVSVVLYSATGTPNNLIVRTDANNSLIVTSVTQVNPVTQGVFSSRTLRTDSSGNLQVILSGTVTPTFPMAIPASTCAAPSLGLSGGATTGIAFTATPSILMCIAGTAVETLTATTNTLTVSELITRGTITTDLKVRDDTVTWNNAGVTFVGWKLNATDTASNAASLLLQLQTGAANIFTVTKTGAVSIGGSSSSLTLGDISLSSRIITNSRVLFNTTAPTIASGGCTSPAITNNNGTGSFLVTIGTSCTGIQTFTLTMPAATNQWACDANNNTSDAAQASNYIIFRATSTTAVVATSYDRATGLTEDFTASDTYRVKCLGG
jgi:hypothetical protein